MSEPLRALIGTQDGVVTTVQLVEHGISRSSISHRTQQGRWRWLLPGVLLTQSGYPTRRQRVVAACLWAGPDCAVDGESACYWYGVGTVAPRKVHIVVPWQSAARSQSFVVVRRTIGEIIIGERSHVPYVDPATALIVAAKDAETTRAAITVIARGLQVGLVAQPDLARARTAIGDKGCRHVDRALMAIGVGLRSPAERDFERLVARSRALPKPTWNQWLDLGDGGAPVCVDALWDDAGLVHEVNGRLYHAWGAAFEEMQARHDRLTVAGLVVMHNAPSRIAASPVQVLAEIERAYARYRGRGLPDQVREVQPPTGDSRYCG